MTSYNVNAEGLRLLQAVALAAEKDDYAGLAFVQITLDSGYVYAEATNRYVIAHAELPSAFTGEPGVMFIPAEALTAARMPPGADVVLCNSDSEWSVIDKSGVRTGSLDSAERRIYSKFLETDLHKDSPVAHVNALRFDMVSKIAKKAGMGKAALRVTLRPPKVLVECGPLKIVFMADRVAE